MLLSWIHVPCQACSLCYGRLLWAGMPEWGGIADTGQLQQPHTCLGAPTCQSSCPLMLARLQVLSAVSDFASVRDALSQQGLPVDDAASKLVYVPLAVPDNVRSHATFSSCI